ncbi:MAG: hypothetical protein Ct9H300mP1_04360 [Planctomycetaceae bacterium]|nr:MAG: hypothetical protein Ct9H300mP1_04360 [Planctomycetaceae bacterium]
MQAILQTADLITFYTCAEKEVHAWLLRRGLTASMPPTRSIWTSPRGGIRAEVTPCDKLLDWVARRRSRRPGCGTSRERG